MTSGTGERSMMASKKPRTMRPSAIFGRHATRLDVIALILVDRAHRRGMGAADIVLQDVEVGHGVGVRPFVEDEVVVGLAGVAAHGSPVDPDEPAVDRARRPSDGALAQQLTRGARGHMVLQGSDVVHLGPVTEIGGEDLTAGVLPLDRDVGADPVVGGTEADGEGAKRRLGGATASQPRQSTRRHRRRSAATRRRATAPSAAASSVTGTTRLRSAPSAPAKTSTTDTRGPLPDAHAGAWEGARTVAPVHDEHGRVQPDSVGHIDEDRVRSERVVEAHQGVPALLHRPQHVGRAGHVVGPPERRHPCRLPSRW